MPAPLQTLHCKSNILISYLSPSPPTPTDPPCIIRIDLSQPSVVDTIELPLPPLFASGGPNGRPAASFHAMHCDPTGRHAIVSLTSGDNFYIALSPSAIAQHSAAAAAASRRAGPSGGGPAGPLGPAIRPLNKLKGAVISSVGWHPASYTNPSSVSHSSREILLGAQNGALIAAVLVDPTNREGASDSPFAAFARSGGTADRYVKHLWTAPEGQEITGVAWETWVPGAGTVSKRASSAKKGTRRVAAVVTTATRITQFAERAPIPKGKREDEEPEGALLERLFSAYANGQMAPRKWLSAQRACQA